MGRRDDTSGSAWKGLRYLKERGLKEFAAHAVEKVHDSHFNYQTWIRSQQISSVAAGYQRKLRFPRMPKIYVMIGGEGESLQADQAVTVRSVRESTYPKVEVIHALNSQIRDEDYVTFVQPGDLVERNAFFEMVSALQDGAAVVYTDEDQWEGAEQRVYSDPLFKPDYDPDYLRSCNYIGNLFLVRVGIIRSLYEDHRKEITPTSKRILDPAYRYAMTLRCSDIAQELGGVVHVPKVLYHARRCADDPYADGKLTARMRAVLEGDLADRGLEGTVEDGALPGTFHVRYKIEGEPLVSIIIPSCDNASVLENCIWSIRNKSSWKNYEIIVVENNSKQPQTFELYEKLEKEGSAKIIRYHHAFHFSRVINEGVKKSSGQYLVLMNNDVTVRTQDWIERLLAQVISPKVAAAGPKLLFPDGRVQSAGIVVGLMGFAGSMMVAEDGEDPGYMGRASLVQGMSALTAACMMVKRKAFLEAGGFPDEFTVALGDVDFCLSLKELGYRIIFEPTAVMIHHESLTRGAEDTKEKKKRFAAEVARFQKKRARILKDGDPAYNPNLSRRRCDYSQQT